MQVMSIFKKNLTCNSDISVILFIADMKI